MARRRPMSLPRRIGLLLERTKTEKGRAMTKILAGITTSVDGFIAGPDDGPGRGLGTGGERLHYWVFGGPWSYGSQRDFGSMNGVDREVFDDPTSGLGAGVCGRGMYDASGAWGGTNPFPGRLFVLTHRLADAPDPATRFPLLGRPGAPPHPGAGAGA